MKRKKDQKTSSNVRKKLPPNYHGLVFLLSPSEEFETIEKFIVERHGTVIHEKDTINQFDPINFYVVANKHTWKQHYSHTSNVVSVDFFDDHIDTISITKYFIQPLLRGILLYILCKNPEIELHIVKTITRLGGIIGTVEDVPVIDSHRIYVLSKEDPDFDLKSCSNYTLITVEDLCRMEETEICRVGDCIPDFKFEELCLDFPIFESRNTKIVPVELKEVDWDHDMPVELFQRIMTFLPLEDYLNTRLVCRGLAKNLDGFWKKHCQDFIKEHSWIPLIDMNSIRGTLNWFDFWSKHLRPIQLDLNNISKHFCTFYHLSIDEFHDLTSLKSYDLYNLAIVMETSICFNPEIGISKFGGFPDLPSTLSWPDGYKFHCQINTRVDDYQNTFCAKYHNIPDGIYYFFYSIGEDEQSDAPLVLFYDGDLTSLVPTHDPNDNTELLHFVRPNRCYKVKFFETIGIISTGTYYGIFGSLLGKLGTSVPDTITVLPHLPFRTGTKWNYQALFGNASNYHPRITEGVNEPLLHCFLQTDVFLDDQVLEFPRDVFTMTFAVDSKIMFATERDGDELADAILLLTSP